MMVRVELGTVVAMACSIIAAVGAVLGGVAALDRRRAGIAVRRAEEARKIDAVYDWFREPTLEEQATGRLSLPAQMAHLTLTAAQAARSADKAEHMGGQALEASQQVAADLRAHMLNEDATGRERAVIDRDRTVALEALTAEVGALRSDVKALKNP